jgi:HNH endonuclease
MAHWNRIDWPIEQMKQWYEEGLTLKQIGDRLGRDFRLVHKAFRKQGIPTRPPGHNCQGSSNPAWNGGVRRDKQGYILVKCPDHPHTTKQGYVRQHRLVAEEMLGRYLLPTEVVHHKDDDPGNNDPSNLMVYETNAQHLAETLKGKCPNWTPEGRERTLQGVRRSRRRSANPPSSGDDDFEWP